MTIVKSLAWQERHSWLGWWMWQGLVHMVSTVVWPVWQVLHNQHDGWRWQELVCTVMMVRRPAQQERHNWHRWQMR